MPEDAALLVEGEPDVSRLLSVVYDPDVGTLAEVQLPDGRLVYGFDPALPR